MESSSQNNEKTDYSKGHFVVPLENKEAIFYAAIDVNYYRDEGDIDFTGGFHVYLLHPKFGSVKFNMVHDPVEFSEGWGPDKLVFPVEEEIISKIIFEIKKHDRS